MNITEITGKAVCEIKKPTGAEMQNEFRFLIAEELTEKLLENELISADEFFIIMVKNLETFSPFISKIML